MITQNKIKLLFEEVAISYEQCWDVLCLFKDHKVRPEDGNKIFGFQSILGGALLKLEHSYNDLSHDKIHLISKKENLSPIWFKHRMKSLADLQDSIMQVINLGKSLGDAYVWAFYSDEKVLLLDHLKHAKISHFPTGVGGRGEIEFVKRVRHVQGYFVLHHSITNILRVGDISLIDLENKKVVALGEMKTRKINDHEYQVSITFIGNKEMLGPLSTNIVGQKIDFDLAIKNRDKLRKQLKTMSQSVKKMILQEKIPIDQIEDETYLPQLKALLDKSKSLKFGYERAGDGMLIVVWKGRKISFYSKFKPEKNKYDFSNKFQELIPNVLTIVDSSTDQNSIMLGSLPYSRKNEMNIFPGMVPMFWWPISLKLLKQIYFHDIIIITIFNPIHLFKRIEMLGFSIETNEIEQKYHISKMDGKFIVELGNFEYFITMIINFLFSENAIIKLIEVILSKTLSVPITHNTKIDLIISQRV